MAPRAAADAAGASNAPAAGAGEEEGAERRAGPVALGDPAGRKGYRLRAGERYRRAVADRPTEAVLVAYEHDRVPVGLFATPAVETPDRRGGLPAEAATAAEFLYTDAGRRLLATMGVLDEDVGWRRSVEVLGGQPGTGPSRLLGGPCDPVRLVGVTTEGTVLLAHVARTVHDGDVVVAVDAREQALAERSQLVGDGPDAVFPQDALPAWGDWFLAVCDDVARADHDADGDGLASVEILHPQPEEVVRDGVLARSGRAVETGIAERPFAVLSPQARTAGPVDAVTWAVRTVGPDGATGDWVAAGEGACARVRLVDRDWGPTAYELRATARGPEGGSLATARRTVTVDLWGTQEG